MRGGRSDFGGIAQWTDTCPSFTVIAGWNGGGGFANSGRLKCGTGMGYTVRASTIQRIWLNRGGGSNSSAFKSGPGGVTKFPRRQIGEEKLYHSSQT